ncbi:MAG: alcohol dehydrogenase catalytic domain-containing protein [Deltaproteobacteria bacterium]|nr:alcohol dehydrogenase catalytic domain-containing protein [Deltaproteobacteria bacterium]
MRGIHPAAGTPAMANSRSVVLTAPRQMSMQEFPLPKLEKESLLLKIELVAICGSDVHLYEGVGFKASFPKILGHEFVGHIVDMGEKAAESYGLRFGDRVTVEPYVLALSCDDSRLDLAKKIGATEYFQACQPLNDPF